MICTYADVFILCAQNVITFTSLRKMVLRMELSSLPFYPLKKETWLVEWSGGFINKYLPVSSCLTN